MNKMGISVSCGLAFCSLAMGAVQKQPNIVLIYTDDHGYADLGCQGILDDVKTPHIDALALGGARMTDGHVSAPQCGPSRVGLISGQYQSKFGMEANGDFEKMDGLFETFRDQKTLPARLKEAGYVTGMAGKSHLGAEQAEGLMELGFDKVFRKNSNDSGSWNMNLEGNDLAPQNQSGGYHLEMVSEFACAFINRFKDRPFFFYAAYRAPHVPLDAPQKYLDRFPGEMPERRRQALAMISCVDDGVGEIVATLRKNGLEKDTLIFVIGDNGAPYKIHKADLPGGGPGWDGSLNDPMNGEKGMLSEGGVRVPFVVSWKGTIPPQVYTQPVISLDVAATATALAGLEKDPVLDGVNLIPFLTGENKKNPHQTLYWRWLGQSMIRAGKWKYLRADDREYLYDMEADAEETTNLMQNYPELAKLLHAELGRWANTLTPPGIWGRKSAGMSKTMDEYCNWYLDGNRDLPTPIADAKSGYGKNGAGDSEAMSEDESDEEPVVAPVTQPAKKPAKKPGKKKAKAAAKKKGPSDAVVFKKWDVNQDDVVTLAEYLSGREQNKEALEKVFNKRDTNGNGVWERSEIN